jgi:uncharacterized membrane protein HdeD (DUF308 family)
MLPIITRHWWALVLRGVIAVLFGIMSLLYPPATFEFLALFLAAYLVLDGVFALVLGIRAAENHRRWWPFALEGLADLAAGAIIYVHPEVLVVLVAVWAFVTGLMLLAPAFAIPGGAGRWFLVLNGLISIMLGTIIALRPLAGVVFIVWIVAIYALLFGIGLIMLGFHVRSLHRAPGGPLT